VSRGDRCTDKVHEGKQPNPQQFKPDSTQKHIFAVQFEEEDWKYKEQSKRPQKNQICINHFRCGVYKNDLNDTQIPYRHANDDSIANNKYNKDEIPEDIQEIQHDRFMNGRSRERGGPVDGVEGAS
jgi:hypothetical protein